MVYHSFIPQRRCHRSKRGNPKRTTSGRSPI